MISNLYKLIMWSTDYYGPVITMIVFSFLLLAGIFALSIITYRAECRYKDIVEMLRQLTQRK